jgi:hypothetical protein
MGPMQLTAHRLPSVCLSVYLICISRIGAVGQSFDLHLEMGASRNDGMKSPVLCKGRAGPRAGFSGGSSLRLRGFTHRFISDGGPLRSKFFMILGLYS